MKRVLVLGGYGGFGGRIAEMLAGGTPGFDVLVAGRSLAKARAFCAARPDLPLTPAAVDRGHRLADRLREVEPWLVVDAAGPFQNMAYDVPAACVGAGIHYLDNADGRAFVAGIASLNEQACAAGVAVIAGASSVPALSSAIVDALAEGMDEVVLVDAAIIPSPRAAVGRSVIQAILSYVGQPLDLRQAGVARRAFGWGEIRRRNASVAGRAPLRPRLLALCDVPDLELLSDRYPGRPRVTFRAGAGSDWETLSLWLMSWAVRWRWAPSLAPTARLLHTARAWTARFGKGDRSAMIVRVVGFADGEPIERQWSLVAEKGDGPNTPCLAVPLLARRLADDGVAPGARPAVGLATLAEFEASFAPFALHIGLETKPSRPPLYQAVMGSDFERLPNPVAEMHRLRGAGVAQGRAGVQRGSHPLARLICAAMGFPPEAADVPLTVWFSEEDGVETWERRFGDTGFRSRLSQRGDLLVERFGLLSFGFRLQLEAEGLSMQLKRWWLGPLPMPLALGPRGTANERALDGRFHFDVPIALPLIGPVVTYRGWLERA